MIPFAPTSRRTSWLGICSRLAVAVLLVLVSAPLCGVAQETNASRTLRFREPHATCYHLTASNLVAGRKWTPARLDNTQASRVELGSRVVLQVAEGTDLQRLLSNHGLTVSRNIGSNTLILQAADSASAIAAAASLTTSNGVEVCCPVMRRAWRMHNSFAAAPNDTYFSQLWHLDNRGADGNLAGLDLNIRAAWPLSSGEGVTVAVADCGFQLDHPDLANRASSGPHYNFFTDTASGVPYSTTADHATAVAGLVAAERGNQRGVSGVAPKAQLASWVIFGTSTSTGSETVASDEQLMDMYQYASDRVAVQNHSWGSATTAQASLDALSDAGITAAVTSGRGGKGVVMVRAGGNSRDESVNVNDDGYANDPRVIAVAAVRKDGRACSFSNPGACLLVAAPSGDVLDTDGDGEVDAYDPSAPNVYTTDRTGTLGYISGTDEAASYTGFNGTSASSPQIAGIAALILSANTNLSCRDVQQILIQSARHYDLADPDLRTNGAGLRFSHNQGFGVPDAGFAVELARRWTNRPTPQRITAQSTAVQSIPDDSLRVVCAATGISNFLTSVRCLPSLGPHPDNGTLALPLVYVGQANEELTVNLTNKAALIQRGTSYFVDKIARAARAGAAFAVIFNNTGTSEIQAMGGTDYVPIPAVSIGCTNGEALRDFVAANAETTAQLQLTPATYRFTVGNTLLCEHVGVRLRTTHTSRADVRVTLVSPMGSRSVLQAINTDSSSGPADWTYWTTQHFYESSAGEWRVEVGDERNTTIRVSPSRTVAATGSVTYMQLLVDGVALVDSDHDGLDDGWETRGLGSLSYGPEDDPDGDGFSNAREQILATNPATSDAAFKLDLGALKTGYWRLSWPAAEGAAYTVFSRPSLSLSWAALTNLAGRFPISEFVVKPSAAAGFYTVRQTGNP